VSALTLADSSERDDLGAFTARVVRLEPTALVRLQTRGDKLTAWAATPFDVLATRSVRGTCEPAELTVQAQALLTSLAVERDETVDPGPGIGLWDGEVPPAEGWALADQFIRVVTGSKPLDDTKVGLRMFTAQNIGSIDLSAPESTWYGVDYESGYKKLWGVGQ